MTPNGPSAHLSWTELACHDKARTPYPTSWLDRAVALAAEFETLRETCGRLLAKDAAIVVVSAYRTPEYNTSPAIGGVAKGQHPEGRALDLAPPSGMSLDVFLQAALEQARSRGIIRGIGVYDHPIPPHGPHLHIDLRLEVALAFWKE